MFIYVFINITGMTGGVYAFHCIDFNWVCCSQYTAKSVFSFYFIDLSVFSILENVAHL